MKMDKFWKISKFTIVQQVKGKAFKISTTIILAAVLLLSSLINIIPATKSRNTQEGGNTQTEQQSTMQGKIYYMNKSQLTTDMEGAMRMIYPKVQFETASESYEDITERLSKSDMKEVLLYVTNSEYGYDVKVITAAKCEEDIETDAAGIGQVAAGTIENTLLINNGVSPDKIQEVRTPVNSEVITAGENEKTMQEKIVNMVFPMIVCILLFYIIYFYGYWVASSIVAEKTSRIMELLLTSTSPLELVAGKCAGMGFLAIIQFAAIVVASLIGIQGGGYIASSLINKNATVFDAASVFGTISLYKWLIIIAFFILGYVLYAIFNALVGATVNRLEDLNTAIMPVSFVSVISFYLSYMAIITGGETITKIAAFLPFSSPFYIPASIITDDATMIQMIIALLILAGLIVVFILFTAKVYAVVILHTGNRLRFKDLFKIYKTEK